MLKWSETGNSRSLKVIFSSMMGGFTIVKLEFCFVLFEFCFCLEWWQIGRYEDFEWLFLNVSLLSSTDLNWICHWRQMSSGGPWYRRGVGMWMKLLFISRCLLSSCDCHQSLFLSVWLYFMQCDLLGAVF